VITKEDVERAKTVGAEPAAAAPGMGALAVRPMDIHIEGIVERVPYSGIRKIVGERMAYSAYSAPHVTHIDEVDVTRLVEHREREKKNAEAKGIKLTYLPFIAKATIAALKQFPKFNASLDVQKGEIVLKKYYNIGFAADTPEGLVVVVVRNADKKGILEIAQELATLSEQARSRKIKLEDLRGGTFTITNIGSIGGIFATPIINPPESAILGVYRIKERPEIFNGKVEARKILTLSITFDHRLIDGAEAARFLNEIAKRLEDPDLLLVEVSGHPTQE